MNLTLHEYMELLLALDKRCELIEHNLATAPTEESFNHWMDKYRACQSLATKVKKEGWL